VPLALLACSVGLLAAAPRQSGDRIVLAELFTGSECGPCGAADGGFNKILEEYDRDEVVVLEYHIDIPAPDPMSTKETQERADYYMFGSAAAPTAYFDGDKAYRGGGPRGWDGRYFNHVKDYIVEKLGMPPQFTLTARAAQGFEAGAITVGLRSREQIDDDLRLHIILYEDGIEYTGYNKISLHRNVVRIMVDGPDGIPVALEDGFQEVARQIPREAVSDPDFGAVVFVQDRGSYEVLQAQEVRFGPDLVDARLLHNEGVQLARQGDLDSAIERLTAAVDLDPGAAQGHFTLGMAYATAQMLDEAASSWERSLELDPAQPELHVRVSIVYEQAGNKEAAIKHLEAFLEQAPEHPQAGPQRERLRRLKGG
jgi:tetratricopeptide (TPR) repeat protein